VELPGQLRLRQRVTKGPGSRAAGVAMAFKLIESAQTRWRAVNASHLIALVRAGAVFKNGCLHYVRDKSRVLHRVRAASAADAVHAVAVFSTATPVPAAHAVVPVFPDEEGGAVELFYQDWDMLLHAYQGGRRDHSHPGFGPHVHSHIKLITTRTTGAA
jgi:hypothetical protein